MASKTITYHLSRSYHSHKPFKKLPFPSILNLTYQKRGSITKNVKKNSLHQPLIHVPRLPPRHNHCPLRQLATLYPPLNPQPAPSISVLASPKPPTRRRTLYCHPKSRYSPRPISSIHRWSAKLQVMLRVEKEMVVA